VRIIYVARNRFIQNRSEEEVENFRNASKISIIRGKNVVPKPVMNFAEAGFPPEVMMALDTTDFESPMP
jgi:ATP-dependent RNA helicase DDX5/DBP2